MELIFIWLITTGAVLLGAYLLEGVKVSGFSSALIVALVLGIVNVMIRPIILALAMPINIVTLGLFTFVIDAVIILLIAGVIPGFKVRNFWWALLLVLILVIINAVLNIAVF